MKLPEIVISDVRLCGLLNIATLKTKDGDYYGLLIAPKGDSAEIIRRVEAYNGLVNDIRFALSCGMMTETVCKRFEQAIAGEAHD